MNVEFIDHIGFYRNIYPEGYCQSLINEFDILEEKSVGTNRQQSERSLPPRKRGLSNFL